MPTLLSQAEFAARKAVSRKTVTVWKTAGRLVMVGNRVDLEETECKLAEGSKADSKRRVPARPESVTRSRKGNRSRGQGNKPQVTAGVAPAAAPEVESEAPPAPMPIDADAIVASIRASGTPLSLAEAELLKESALARLRQLEYDQKSGAVVAVADVARAVGQAFARVRTRLLAIPAEQAPRVHRCRTVAEVQDALQDVIVQALEELSAGEPATG